MTSRLLAASLFALAISVNAASAQSGWIEISGQTHIPELQANADTVDDWDVYSLNGKRIGEVEEVLGTEPGKVSALVIDFDDNAGFGDRDDVIVPLDRFSIVDRHLTLSVSAAAVAGMAVYAD